MSRGRMGGSLAFSQADGIVYSSGLIGGRLALKGPLSGDLVTIGLGLRVAPGTWQWMEEVKPGGIGVFLPGDEHDSHYTDGSLYVTLTLSMERLEVEAAKAGVVLDPKTLGGTGFHQQQADTGAVSAISRQMQQIHTSRSKSQLKGWGPTTDILAAAITHYARAPVSLPRHLNPRSFAKIITLSREFIFAHLDGPISVDDIAAAALTSRRTLYRAFKELLGETPNEYVRKIRLHRIRRNLADDAERNVTITLVANRWGISELGRLSGWYKDIYGELPSETLSRQHAEHREDHQS